jgi:hypothetical protein
VEEAKRHLLNLLLAASIESDGSLCVKRQFILHFGLKARTSIIDAPEGVIVFFLGEREMKIMEVMNCIRIFH